MPRSRARYHRSRIALAVIATVAGLLGVPAGVSAGGTLTDGPCSIRFHSSTLTGVDADGNRDYIARFEVWCDPARYVQVGIRILEEDDPPDSDDLLYKSGWKPQRHIGPAGRVFQGTAESCETDPGLENEEILMRGRFRYRSQQNTGTYTRSAWLNETDGNVDCY